MKDVYEVHIRSPSSTIFFTLSDPFKRVLHGVFLAMWKLFFKGRNHGSILESLRAHMVNGVMSLQLNPPVNNRDITQSSNFDLALEDLIDICTLIKYILSVRPSDSHLYEVLCFEKLCEWVKNEEWHSYQEMRNMYFFIYNNALLYSETDTYYFLKKCMIWKHSCYTQHFDDSWIDTFQDYEDIIGVEEHNWSTRLTEECYPAHFHIMRTMLGHILESESSNAHMIIDLCINCRKHVQREKRSASLEECFRPLLKCFPWFSSFLFAFMAQTYFNLGRHKWEKETLFEYFSRPPIPLERCIDGAFVEELG